MTLNTNLSQIPQYINDWYQQLQPVPLAEAVLDAERAAIFSADMVVGFCRQGNLASERINTLTEPIKDLFQRAYDLGVRNFVLLQDTHHERTPEFNTFPPHCLRGTEETETIPELKELPFSNFFIVIEKNSLHPAIDTGFDRWLEEQPNLDIAIVVGNCTDLCVYHLAMHLRMRANARNLTDFQVIVPANALDTYDLPEGAARQMGASVHLGDFFHSVFLFHMALNGIRVVQELT